MRQETPEHDRPHRSAHVDRVLRDLQQAIVAGSTTLHTGVNRLLADLAAASRPPLTPSEKADDEDHPMSDHLAQVVSDALAGRDIIRLHPTFYEALLRHDTLLLSFLEALQDLGETPPEDPDNVPPRLFDLSFLKQLDNTPTFIRTNSQRWRAIWTYTRDRLQTIFNSSPMLEPAFRGEEYSLVDDHFVVLRSAIELDESALDVILEAHLPLDQEDQLQPLLLIRDRYGQLLPSPLLAYLAWGPYREQGAFDDAGMLQLPPIPLDMVLNKEGQITGDLELSIERG